MTLHILCYQLLLLNSIVDPVIFYKSLLQSKHKPLKHWEDVIFSVQCEALLSRLKIFLQVFEIKYLKYLKKF